MSKIAAALCVAVFLAFSLACVDDSSPYDTADSYCTDQHVGKLCVVNHTDYGLNVTFDGVFCGLAEADGGECCMELDSYPSRLRRCRPHPAVSRSRAAWSLSAAARRVGSRRTCWR